MFDYLTFGPQYLPLGMAPDRTAAAEFSYRLIIFSIFALSALLIGMGLAQGQKTYVRSIALVITPWATLNGLAFARGDYSNESLAFPIIVLALALNYHRLTQIYSLLRILIFVTSASSIFLGLWRPDLFLSDPSRQVSNGKAIVGDLLLNGLFPTSNQLGITLAIGLPLVLLTTTGRRRWVLAVPCVIAILWASSRTSLLAISIVLVVIVLVRRGTVATARDFVRPIVIALGAATALLPFLMQDPSKFSGRVGIWKASLKYIQGGDLLSGLGPSVYRGISAVTIRVGAVTGTGHNVFVTALTVGGVLAVLTVALLWWKYLAMATRAYSTDRYPLVFVLTVSALGILEDPLRAFILAPSSFLILPALIVPLAAAEHRERQNSVQALVSTKELHRKSGLQPRLDVK